MHRFRSALVLAFLVIALTPVGRAEAGGPTSALLTVPGEGATASLYYTDPEYEALAGLVGISGDGVGTVDRSGRDHTEGPAIRVTWLIHDVTPWRVDHIYLEGDGAPWIATQTSTGEQNIWDAPVQWHQPGSPRQLEALLDELGLAEAARDAGSSTGVSGADSASPAEPTRETATGQSTGAATERDTAVWWTLAGLLVGGLGGWLLAPLLRNNEASRGTRLRKGAAGRFEEPSQV